MRASFESNHGLDMLEWQRKLQMQKKFIEGFKIDLFADEVLYFSKGVVINLP